MVSSSVDEGAWAPRRRRILEGLRELSSSMSSQSPILSQLYERLVDCAAVYSSDSESGWIALTILSHCARELMNSLPDFLGAPEAVGNNSTAEREAKDALRRVLLEDCDDGMFSPRDGATVVAIPAEVARAMGAYRKEALTGAANDRQRSSLAVLGRIDEGNPALIPWMRAKRFFQRYAHVSRGKEATLPQRDELEGELSHLENVLETRLGYFFDAKARLKDFLEAANAKSPEGIYAVPTEETVQTALSLTANPDLRFVFYSELTNPEWLPALIDGGVFKRVAASGGLPGRFSSWPEVVYLRRMAPVEPLLVERAAVEASREPNPVIRHEVIGLVPLLPAESALRVAHEVVQWAESGFGSGGYFWATDEVIELIRWLLTSRAADVQAVGKKLLVACFMPRRGDYAFSGVNALVPRYAYSESLDELRDMIDGLPLGLRRGVFGGFSKRLLYRLHDGTDSSILINSVEEGVKGRSDSVTGEVIFQLVEALKASLLSEPEKAVKWVNGKGPGNPLIVRCALFAERTLLGECIAEGAPVDGSIARHVREALLSDAILEDEFDPELYPLFEPAVRLGIVGADEVDGLVRRSSRQSLEDLSERAAGMEEPCQEDVERRARRWTHRALSLIGRGSLGAEGQRLYDELCVEFPDASYHATHAWDSATVMGPNGPVKSGEMRGMGAEGLLEHLRTWRPSPDDRFELVSHEGQGRELASLVSGEPFFFAGVTSKILGLRATYQRAVLEGWGSAASAGRDVPIDDALLLLKIASEKPEDEVCQIDGRPYDDDSSYLNLRRAAARFANDLLDAHAALSEGQTGVVLDALMGLARSGEPDERYESEYGGDNEDPLTLSLNTIRPIALLALAKWAKESRQSDRIPEALDALGRHLPTRTSFLSEAAAMGEALPYLYEAAPDWVREHYGDLFGLGEANECQQVVLTTILALYRPTAWLYGLLSRAMLAALVDGAASYRCGFGTDGRDGLSLIGRWVYVGFASGFVSAGDPVLCEWRRVADGEHLGRVLGSVCAAVRESEGMSQEAVSRIAELWDHHDRGLVGRKGGAALMGIGSLIRSGRFEASWWGPRLLRELEVNGHETHVILIEDELETLSKEDPELAVKALRLVMKKDRHPIGRHYHELGLKLLSAAKEHNGGALSAEASKCMNELGMMGCYDLDEQLGFGPAVAP